MPIHTGDSTDSTDDTLPGNDTESHTYEEPTANSENARLTGSNPGKGSTTADSTSQNSSQSDTKAEGAGLSRRSYLGIGAATVAAGLGLTGTVSAATTVHGIDFDRVVNIVDDFGADPTGGGQVTDAIEAAMEPGTLIRFPEGTYQLAPRTIEITADNVGFQATGDAVWKFATGYHGPFIECNGRDNFLFEGIDVDMSGTQEESGHMYIWARSRFHVEDVTYIGRGAGPGYAFSVGIEDDPDGVGTLRNVRVPHGSAPDNYASPAGREGNGRIGVFCYLSHVGTLRVENCEFSEFGNNGIYASRVRGNVQVEDSYFLNNGANNIRLSGAGSWAKRCTVEVDMSKYDGPATDERWGTWGITAENQANRNIDQYGPRERSMLVEDCTVILTDFGPNGWVGAGVRATAGSRGIVVRNTDIHVDDSDGGGRSTHAFLRANPYGDWEEYRDDVSNPPGPLSVHLENVNVTGRASGDAAVRIVNAADSTIKNCCIQQTGSDRDGVRFFGSDGSTVESTNIDVTGAAIDQNGGSISTADITYSDSCATSDGTTGGDSTSDSDTTATTSDSADLPNTVVIEGTGSISEYQFTVSDTVEKNGTDGSINGGDTIEGTTATGVVGSGDDAYDYAGEITDFDLAGDALVYVNGEQTDPATLTTTTTSVSTDLPNILVFDGTGTETSYEFSVTGDVDTSADLGDVEASDTVNASSVTGSVTGDTDGYRFSGDLVSLLVDGDSSVRFEDNDG